MSLIWRSKRIKKDLQNYLYFFIVPWRLWIKNASINHVKMPSTQALSDFCLFRLRSSKSPGSLSLRSRRESSVLDQRTRLENGSLIRNSSVQSQGGRINSNPHVRKVRNLKFSKIYVVKLWIKANFKFLNLVFENFVKIQYMFKTNILSRKKMLWSFYWKNNFLWKMIYGLFKCTLFNLKFKRTIEFYNNISV